MDLQPTLAPNIHILGQQSLESVHGDVMSRDLHQPTFTRLLLAIPPVQAILNIS